MIYCLQEKSTCFGLEVSVIYIELANFKPKNSNKLYKDF